ncbi:hypothetical protein A2U01_0029895, partial [Trifolium medium]|nr:hypothetical protein [Trifolium medium]
MREIDTTKFLQNSWVNLADQETEELVIMEATNIGREENIDTVLTSQEPQIAKESDFKLVTSRKREPWMNIDNYPANWFSSMNLKVFAVNVRTNLLPNLWCLCSVNLDPVVIHADDQQISLIIKEN